MATQLSMPAPAYIPQGEVLAPEPESIRSYHFELTEAARNFRRCVAQIAYYGFRMRLSEGWTALGFESGPRGEEAYRDSLGIPRSTYYKHVRIGQMLHQLPLEDLARIPTTNAELLIQVNPTLTHDHNWVREAQTMKPAQFAQLVTSRNKTVGDDREPMTGLNFRVPFLAKQAIENMIEVFQHRHELSSRGQALELMVADRHADPNLLSSVHQARQLLHGVLSSMSKRKAGDSEEAVWTRMAKEILDESYEKAVQAARQKPARNQADGGRP